MEGGLYLDICTGAQEFLVTSLLMGPVCLSSQGRFEEPFRAWTTVSSLKAIFKKSKISATI